MADCSHPVHIRATEVHTTTGEVRRRELLRRCGARLASKCESCSDLYAGDAREVINSGTTDGGSFTWITLTAPGADVFGAVHSGPAKRGRRRCACGRYHRPDDVRLGTPVDPARYDYAAAGRFNATLSRRFTVLMQKLRRMTGERLDFVRVVEFQRRGLTHVHALVRGAVSPEMLQVAVRGGTNLRTGRRIAAVTSGGFGFGPQCDAQAVTDAGRVGSYMRKLVRYAVKAAGDDLPDGSRHARAMARAGASCVGCSKGVPVGCRDEPGRLNDDVGELSPPSCRPAGLGVPGPRARRLPTVGRDLHGAAGRSAGVGRRHARTDGVGCGGLRGAACLLAANDVGSEPVPVAGPDVGHCADLRRRVCFVVLGHRPGARAGAFLTVVTSQRCVVAADKHRPGRRLRPKGASGTAGGRPALIP